MFSCPSVAGLDERYRAQREVALYYGFTDAPDSYAMLRSLWRLENGGVGNEAGHENPRRDAEVYANPCLSPGSHNYAKSARAMIRFTMEWVMNDDWLRKKWSQDFAKWYHSKTPQDNAEYAKTLRKIYLQEMSATVIE